jgi:serine/threonine protein phosphatase PrpC
MAENYFGLTDTGRQRDNNEDAFIAEVIMDGKYIMACVIDGVGGYEGGEIAAAIARASILEYFSVPSGDLSTMMREAISSANQKIFNEKLKNEELSRMACVLTLAVVDVENNKFSYAHVGDTRLYLLRDHTLVKITHDHSFVGFLEDSGRLSEKAAMDHPKRNEINKALGFEGQIGLSSDYIETGESPFLPDDIILLCSDGLSDMINNGEMTRILSSGETLRERAEKLVEAANMAGGKDNITVVLVHNNNAPVKLKATRPVAVKKKAVLQKDEPEAATQKIILPSATRSKSNSSIVVILSFLCIAFLAAFFWLLMRPSTVDKEHPVAELLQTASGKRLQDTIRNLQNDTLILSEKDFGQVIYLADTIVVDRDSLYIKADGNIRIVADSAYRGAGFIITPSIRILQLDSLVFQNFRTAIVSSGSAVRLKNVRFDQCDEGVQYLFKFNSGQYINGVVRDSLLFKKDSLPKK